ncbi:extracellular solute-binding protein [Paenibacillaceae bacterium]|nr:extracellular solute-binding protein [Paenibacillaceae bacterium]
MKQMKASRWIAMMAALVLLAGLLAACGGNNAKGGNNAPNSGDTPGKSGTAEQTEPVELSLFINHAWYPVNSWTGPVAEEITKKTGVKLKVTIATDSKQLPLAIASGDLPDLIFTSDELDRLSNPDISYAWDELIEQYTPNFTIDPTRIAISTVDDGHFYTIRNSFATQAEWDANQFALGSDGNPGVAVRKDIMEELGNPPINTLDDFVSVLESVKSKYPDLIPLVMDVNWTEAYFQTQFGVTAANMWDEQDGQVQLGVGNPKILEYYKFMNSLYRKGLILAENFAYANDQIDDEYATSGKAFAHMHTVSVAERNNLALEKTTQDFRFQQLPVQLTDKALRVNDGVGFSGLFITKKNKHPEASMKLVEFLASDEGKKLTMFGVEGEHWTWNDEGYPNLNYNPSDTEFVSKNGIKWWYLYSDAIVEGLWGYVPGTQTTQALIETKEITQYKPELGLIQVKADSKERTIKTKIEEMIKNERVRVILSDSEEQVEKNYANMLENARKIGLDELNEWGNQEYMKKKQLFE